LLLAVFLVGLCAWLPTDGTTLAVAGLETRSQPIRPTSSYLARDREKQSAENKQRLREGTKITNRLGRFRQSGDRATFVTENRIELGGLPNLSLERVVRMLKNVDEPESIWWSVSGLVTEFSGRNYLLIERAVYKSATPPPAPEKVEP
jgi:hypothetical protein